MTEELVTPAIADQVVLITGGTRGIGAACVAAFAAAGASVVLCGRDELAGTRVAAGATRTGPGSALFLPADVADVDQLRSVIEHVITRFGRLNTLVNNAATFATRRTIDQLEIAEVEYLMKVNFIAYFAAAKYALPHLRAVGGSIVNINSVVGVVGGTHDSAYAASKGAGSAFTRSLAIDEAPRVRVNGVVPGNAMTEQRIAYEASLADPGPFHAHAEATQWMGRSARPAEVAAVVLFLASPAASFITGTDINVTGGAELGMGLRIGWPTQAE